MNFDRLAPHYSWMEIIFAGPLMQRCRTTFLARTTSCRHALLLGEGAGKFLTALLRHNPRIRVTCVEQSAGMIAAARRRLTAAGLDERRVQFHQADALDWTPPAGKFDLVGTHFFLDCFPAAQLQKLVPRLTAGAAPNALWLVSDFRMPDSGWRRWRAGVMLTLLYAFFRLTTSLPARRLTPPEPLLAAAGFVLEDRRLASHGFAHADCWRRVNV